MQHQEPEKNNYDKLKDEDSINFRPSPNFKHMKKYLKSKFEESNSSPDQIFEETDTMSNVNDYDKVKTLTAAVHPPLPPNPPPDTLDIIIKKEIENDEYTGHSLDSNQTEEQNTENKKEPNIIEKSDRVMCRQYVRGNCTRGSSCIYTHELILSQLPAVYTFCKNYQNTSCNLPKCKFVHASVFEKEHFYRTGQLPPHTLAHLKENSAKNDAPHAQAKVEGPAVKPPDFSNPPPSAVNQRATTLPVISCTPAANLEKPVNEVLSIGAMNSPPFKRDWNEIDSLRVCQASAICSWFCVQSAAHRATMRRAIRW